MWHISATAIVSYRSEFVYLCFKLKGSRFNSPTWRIFNNEWTAKVRTIEIIVKCSNSRAESYKSAVFWYKFVHYTRRTWNSTETGPSAHNVSAKHDAKTTYLPAITHTAPFSACPKAFQMPRHICLNQHPSNTFQAPTTHHVINMPHTFKLCPLHLKATPSSISFSIIIDSSGKISWLQRLYFI